MELTFSVAIVHGVKGDEGLREVLGERYEKVVTLALNASRGPQRLEEKILWDANIFDALGAIGLARAFTKGGYEGQSIEETVRIVKENMRRPFFTQDGRRMAEQRIKLMKRFLDRLEEEMSSAKTVLRHPPSP